MGLSPVALLRAVSADVGHLNLGGSPLDYVGLSYKQFASTYLCHSLIRKYIPSDTRDADRAAWDTFTSANNRCREWFLPKLDEFDSIILNQMRVVLDDFLHPLGECLVGSYFDLLRCGRPGPGVAVGGLYTSYYTKYMSSQLSTTSPFLYDEYRRYAEWIPTLHEAEAVRRERFGSTNIVNGSRCCFVPKTSATSRMICIEPSLNIYYQLGLAQILESRLRSFFGIDLRTQPNINRALARIGSKDGSLSTIDLSSASDSISLRLCEMLFPKWFFELLLVLRSRTVQRDGVEVPLFMISTMGNGFTFPLQTIIFSALLKSVSSIYERQYGRKFIWTCFGDDLVCDSFCYRTVVRLLSSLNFIPNPLKSFNEGPFRESCGADWFFGQPVRPVFVKRLDSPFDILVTINQLNEWTAYTGIPLRNAVHLLIHSLAPKFRNFVPLSESLDAGIRTHSFFIKPSFDRNLSYAYKAWGRRPLSIRIGEGSIRTPVGWTKKIDFNPAGLYCSFLFGELVSFTIMVRHDLKLYRTRRRIVPNWDYVHPESSNNGMVLSQQQWKTALLANLS